MCRTSSVSSDKLVFKLVVTVGFEPTLFIRTQCIRLVTKPFIHVTMFIVGKVGFEPTFSIPITVLHLIRMGGILTVIVQPLGFEPRTHGLKARYSTN